MGRWKAGQQGRLGMMQGGNGQHGPTAPYGLAGAGISILSLPAQCAGRTELQGCQRSAMHEQDKEQGAHAFVPYLQGQLEVGDGRKLLDVERQEGSHCLHTQPTRLTRLDHLDMCQEVLQCLPCQGSGSHTATAMSPGGHKLGTHAGGCNFCSISTLTNIAPFT